MSIHITPKLIPKMPRPKEQKEGKSIDLLMNLVEKGEQAMRTINLDSQKPASSLLDELPDFMERYASLIDAGYYLKGVDNESVVETMGEYNTGKKKGVVHLTMENEKVIQIFGKEDKQPLQNRKDIKMDERLTYYDQVHTIGTDIPHAQTARACLTIGEKMYIKDLLQGMWRMRKLDKGQKVDFILSDNVKKLIIASRSALHPNPTSSRITLQDIILFCISNQANRVAEDNLRGQHQALVGLVPNTLFWQLVEVYRSKLTLGIRKALFKLYRPSLLKTMSRDVDGLAKVSVSEQTPEVLNQLRRKLIGTYEGVQAKLHLTLSLVENTCTQKIGEAINRLRDLPLLKANKLPKRNRETLSNGKKTLKFKHSVSSNSK